MNKSYIPINIKDVQRFIETNYIDKLGRDLKELHIAKEHDMQYRSYFHIQSYFDDFQNTNWLTLNTPYMKKIRKLPDILILRMGEPKIAMELKQGVFKRVNTTDLEDDIKKLKLILKTYSTIQKCYLIHMFDEAKTYKETQYKHLKELIGNRFITKIEYLQVNLAEIIPPNRYHHIRTKRNKYLKYE